MKQVWTHRDLGPYVPHHAQNRDIDGGEGVTSTLDQVDLARLRAVLAGQRDLLAEVRAVLAGQRDLLAEVRALRNDIAGRKAEKPLP